MRIGVIGLGAMGRGISARLLQAGHEVLVWNRSPSAADDVVAKGAVRVETPVQAAQDDIVLSILFDDAAIRDTLVDGGVLAKASADCTHVCLSTVSLPFAVELEKLHADIGLRYVAAPMLGRPEVVERGALNMLVGGDPTVVKRVEAVLANIGHVYRIGDVPHEAQAAKLAANFMISGAIETMAEAAAMLKAYGTDIDRFFSVMVETLFGAFVYKSYGPMVSGHRPQLPSGLDLPLKDNRSFLDAVAAAGLRSPTAETVRALLQRAKEAGMGREDWATALSAVAQSKC